MRTTKFLGAVAAILLGLTNAKAQWVNTGTANTTVEYNNGNVGIGAFDGTTQPTSPLHFYLQNPIINLQSSGGMSTNSGINFGTTYGLQYTTFPNYGTGRIHLYSGTNTLNFGLHMSSNSMLFGVDNSLSGFSSFLGNFSFNGEIGATSLALSPTIVGSTVPYTIPSGNLLGVNGGTYLNGNVTMPGSNTLTLGTSGTTSNNLTVFGSSTFSGKTNALAFQGYSTFGSDATPTGRNALLTVNGGDIYINETTASSQETDLGGADLYLFDKNGSGLDFYVQGGHGYLQFANIGTGSTAPSDFTIGNWNTNYLTIYNGSNNAGVINIGNCPLPSNPLNYRLYVKTGILTEKIRVASSSDNTRWADFVFDKNYKLRSLNDVEKYINKNHHLPEIPSAEEVGKSGVDLLDMDAKLLQKVEELTLYMIQFEKKNTELEKKNRELEDRLKQLEKGNQ